MAATGYYDSNGLFIPYPWCLPQPPVQQAAWYMHLPPVQQAAWYMPQPPVQAPILQQPKKRLEFKKITKIDPEIKLELEKKYNISKENQNHILEYFSTINTTLFNKTVNIMDIYLLWSMSFLPENIKAIFSPIFQDAQFYINSQFWSVFPIIKKICTQGDIPFEESHVHFFTIYVLWYIKHISLSNNIEEELLKKTIFDIYYEINVVNGNYKNAFINGKISVLMYYIFNSNKFEIIQNDTLKTIIKNLCIKLRDININLTNY